MEKLSEKSRILLVEDNAIIAKDLQRQLEELGYTVPFIAATGSDAIRKVKENKIDLVLMDIMLAGEMDGIETADQMRTRDRVPVVYLTAYTDEATLKRAKITEPYGYLVKPVSDIEMRRVIEMAIYKSNMEKKHREQLAGLVKERTAELTAANELLRKEMAERSILEKAILETEDRELQRIGYELHDGLGQLLTGLSLKSQSLEDILKEKLMPEAELASRVTFLINKAKEHLRFLMQGSLPMENVQHNIMLSLEELASRTTRDFNVPCFFKSRGPVTIKNKSAVIHLYRIVQEAVTNALKHGNPGHIEINLTRKKDTVVMTVKDNGTGMPDEHKQKAGLGLKIMNCRANMIGALLDIRSEINSGTSITCAFIDNDSGKE
jgi:signal transduction histidine kinase